MDYSILKVGIKGLIEKLNILYRLEIMPEDKDF